MKRITNNISFILQLVRLLLTGNTGQARRWLLGKHINLLKRYYARQNHQGIRVITEKWDYLIILDACRYDDFARLNRLEGRLEKKVSQATNTSEWLRRNFTGYYPDVIYISSNPHCSDHLVDGFRGTDHFYKVEHVWKYGWDKALDTVPPHEVTQAALKALDQYPDKRMIIHYIQPHGPWIGKTQISSEELVVGVLPMPGVAADNTSTDNGQWTADIKAWHLVQEGRLDVKVLRQAALGNLELVLAEVEKLVQHLPGKVVVSADHGEAFGEKWVYAHPWGVYIKELVEVPWLVIDKGKIKRQAAHDEAQPLGRKEAGEEMAPEEKAELEERLIALGYME